MESAPARPGLLNQEILPIRRYPSGWTRHRLVERMVLRRCETRPVHVFARLVVPEPVFPGLETTDHGVVRRRRVGGRVPAG